ncbi:response regulator transcription factor [Schinkia azotoformans]|uniref:response regulator transcription factor n=1 Tax=Schinkia azotoformans TaxID=1454 RepID=UPI002DB647C5|nr:response regulator transcription factor [Schinkia azotoformans]MEC1722561.1 response regulator transcription factor [Schinkia azotoformans]MED4411548.1 response regulator transcription factor [Schinkia azotoformans]
MTKILIVEDDENIREVVAEYLKDAGYVVIVAEDGKKAYDIITTTDDIDLYILDIMLPEITGIELLKFIRKQADTPVLMLTALDDEETQLISFNALVDDYVTKPFSPKLLVKRVESLLRRTGKIDHLLQVGPISLDVDSYSVFANGEKLTLTLKEFELLKVLMKNKGKVLSRQQLLNYAWGYDYFGDERIVDVHIKNVRKKINIKLIQTVKGVGYKIDDEWGGR